LKAFEFGGFDGNPGWDGVKDLGVDDGEEDGEFGAEREVAIAAKERAESGTGTVDYREDVVKVGWEG
jgi:hypothetical protein